MKTFFVVVALCLALSFAPSTNAARLDRSLKQASVSASASCNVANGKCQSTARVTTDAINDAVRTLTSAVDVAVDQANGGGDAVAIANTFAQAVSTAFARITSSHVLTVHVNGDGRACSYTKSNGQAHATSISTAVSRAFAAAENDLVKAAAGCYSKAVSAAAVTAIQNVDFNVCTNYGYEYLYAKIQTTAFVRAVATSFGHVLAAVKNNDAIAAESCGTQTSVSAGSNTQGTVNSSG